MKCPKCSYLGFETGNQCRNCGYDFSLMVSGGAPDGDLPLRPEVDHPPTPPRWSEAVDRGLGTASAPVGPSRPFDVGPAGAGAGREEDLPLFHSADGDDTPLITIAPSPRVPLAVRRTPPAPRRVARAAPRAQDIEPLLEFADEASVLRGEPRSGTTSPNHVGTPESRAGRRVAAVALDTGILFAIDATVVYLTLRIAEVPAAEWSALPLLPVVAFLALMKLSYYSVFTAFGGQTIGKMATGIRVVGEAGPVVEPARAVGRSLLAGASVLLLGLPLVPWLVGRDGRTLHDRIAHTRVVTQRVH